MPKENKKKILILGESSDIGIEVVKIFIKKIGKYMLIVIVIIKS